MPLSVSNFERVSYRQDIPRIEVSFSEERIIMSSRFVPTPALWIKRDLFIAQEAIGVETNPFFDLSTRLEVPGKGNDDVLH